MNGDLFAQAAEEIGLKLTSEQIQQFQQFEDALYKANEVMNLTRVPKEDCWQRHFLDSLLFQDLIPRHAFVLDIGTGPGFPSWPLACARPDIKITTIDSNGKMIGFLQQNELPNLTNIQDRAENWKVNERFDFVTGRALAPLSTQLELSARPCKIKGQIVPMRSESDRDLVQSVDLEPLGLEYVETIERPMPGTDITRLFPVYKKVAKTKHGFPRRWAEIKSYPL